MCEDPIALPAPDGMWFFICIVTFTRNGVSSAFVYTLCVCMFAYKYLSMFDCILIES